MNELDKDVKIRALEDLNADILNRYNKRVEHHAETLKSLNCALDEAENALGEIGAKLREDYFENWDACIDISEEALKKIHVMRSK